MTYDDAERIRRMIDGHWNLHMNEDESDLWLSALVGKDAEIATKAVAYLSRKLHRPPKISDLEEVIGMLSPGHSHAPTGACATCGGDMFVVYSLRSPDLSKWQIDRGIENRRTLIEQFAPCPECNTAVDTEYRRADGTIFRCPDPAMVREMMSR